MSRSGKRKPKRGPAWWPCETSGKRGFATKLDTLTVLSQMSRSKNAKRSYRCPDCGRWHVTSR